AGRKVNRAFRDAIHDFGRRGVYMDPVRGRAASRAASMTSFSGPCPNISSRHSGRFFAAIENASIASWTHFSITNRPTTMTRRDWNGRHSDAPRLATEFGIPIMDDFSSF